MTTQALEKLRELREEQARRLKYEAYRYYTPTGKGEEFINAVGSGENFIVLYSAANGVGKTATCANILAHLFYPCGNEWFQGKIFKDFPYLKRGRIVSTPTNIEKNIIPELKKWFPRGKYKTSKGNKKFESIWETDSGWEFDVMTYEQDAMEFEGATLGWAWFDEPPPEAIFKATISRMRKGGLIFIGATPLAGSAYLYDAFAKGSYTVELTSTETGAKMIYERKVAYIQADIESACKIHGVRGHLEHEHILSIIAEYSEDDKQARIYGKFQHLVGLVFKNFDRKVHVIKPFLLNMRDYSVMQYLDPHPRNPDAALWIATDRQNTHFVIDELWFNGTLPEVADRIKKKDAQYRIVGRKADPSMFNKNQHDEDGKSLADRIADDPYNIYYQPASKQRTAANRRILDAFSYIEVNGHIVKPPEIYIFDTCERTIFEIEHYRWDEYIGKSADKHMPKEKPIDKDDHMIENLGRFLIEEPKFVPPPIVNERVEEINHDPYA